MMSNSGVKLIITGLLGMTGLACTMDSGKTSEMIERGRYLAMLGG